MEQPNNETAISIATGKGLREIRADGLITNEELKHRGISSGCNLLRNEDRGEGWVYTLIALDSIMKEVTLQAKGDGEDEEDDEPFNVCRVDLIKDYRFAPETKVQAHHPCVVLALDARAISQF